MIERSSQYIFALILCLFAGKAKSQKQYLSKDEFIRVVRAFHPIVKLSNVNLSKAGANIQLARGAFDPTVSTYLSSKELKGDLYYSYFNTEVNIPTWYGVDIKAGIDNSSGARIDPEITSGGVSYVGVKFSLNSLIYDKRRAALQQAKLVREMTMAQQQLAVNDLIFDALSAYWLWVKEYEQLQVIQKLVDKINERIHMVKLEVEQGSRPALDSIEAIGQYYSMLQQQKNTEQLYRNASLELSAYMWLDNCEPYTMPDFVIPDVAALNTEFEHCSDLNGTLGMLDVHPKLKIMDTKIEALDVERRLKMQGLIPRLSVNAAALNYNGSNLQLIEQPVVKNYKFSIDLNVPILMREARGALQATNYKIQEQKIEKSHAYVQLAIKLKSYYSEYLSLKGQVKDCERLNASYSMLLEGEIYKYNAGESTLFLVNSRELKYMEAAQKLIDLKAKLQKAYAGILFSAGLLG